MCVGTEASRSVMWCNEASPTQRSPVLWPNLAVFAHPECHPNVNALPKGQPADRNKVHDPVSKQKLGIKEKACTVRLRLCNRWNKWQSNACAQETMLVGLKWTTKDVTNVSTYGYQLQKQSAFVRGGNTPCGDKIWQFLVGWMSMLGGQTSYIV